jgi:hypothetical protein
LVDEAMIAAAGARMAWSDPAGPHVRPDRAGLRLVSEKSAADGLRMS